MSIPRCSARLTLDGQALAADASALVLCRVELALGGVHDLMQVVVGHQSPFASAATGVDAAIEIGFGDELTQVFTGLVSGVERRDAGVCIEALGSSVKLSFTRLGRSWRQVTAQDVVADLLGVGDVAAGEVVAPMTIAAYHVDERRPVWAHLRALAALAGCELSSDGTGALNVRPARAAAQSSASLRYGADLLARALGDVGATVEPAFSVVPYGAASEQGPDAWHVLLKEPDGGPPDAPTLVPGAVRDEDGAHSVSRALDAATQRRRTAGQLSCVGNPALRAGDVVSVSGLPAADDAALRLISVRHLIDRADGFRTLLTVQGAA